MLGKQISIDGESVSGMIYNQSTKQGLISLLAIHQTMQELEREFSIKIDRKNMAIRKAIEKITILESNSNQWQERWHALQQYAVMNPTHSQTDTKAYDTIRQILLGSHPGILKRTISDQEPLSESDVSQDRHRNKRKRTAKCAIPIVPIGGEPTLSSSQSVSIDEANVLLQMTRAAHIDQSALPAEAQARKETSQQPIVPSQTAHSSFDMLVESCLSADQFSGFSGEDQGSRKA